MGRRPVRVDSLGLRPPLTGPFPWQEDDPWEDPYPPSEPHPWDTPAPPPPIPKPPDKEEET